MPQGFPGIPSQGLDLVEPVMYLSWTGDVPVMHRPIAAPRENLQEECLTLMGFMSAAGVEPIAHPFAFTAGFMLGVDDGR